MLNHPTYERLTQLRLTGMARALAEQAQHPDIQALTFEERLGLLVEREADERHHRQTSTRLRRERLPRLLEELAIAHADGRFLKLMAALAKVDVLILDDWGLAILDGERRRDLLELLDERYQTRSTRVTSPLPVAHWHDALGDPTLADAILDRLVPPRPSPQPRRGIPAKNPTQIDGGTHTSVNSIYPVLPRASLRSDGPGWRGTGVQLALEWVSSWRGIGTRRHSRRWG